MPEIPDVVSGQPVASSWGNDVRDRVLQRYADSAELAALSPLPAPGELAYLDDTQEALMWNGSDWLPIARVNFQSILMYGNNQGYWLRPDPADNTKDWRLVAGTDGTVLLQSRATGSFQTVDRWWPDNRQPVTLFSYSNGWQTYFTPMGCWQLPGGTVHLQGMIRNGTGNVIATGQIPAAMRPATTQIVWIPDSAGKLTRIDINNAGSIAINGSAPTVGVWLTFAGVAWMAGQ